MTSTFFVFILSLGSVEWFAVWHIIGLSLKASSIVVFLNGSSSEVTGVVEFSVYVSFVAEAI